MRHITSIGPPSRLPAFGLSSARWRISIVSSLRPFSSVAFRSKPAPASIGIFGGNGSQGIAYILAALWNAESSGLIPVWAITRSGKSFMDEGVDVVCGNIRRKVKTGATPHLHETTTPPEKAAFFVIATSARGVGPSLNMAPEGNFLLTQNGIGDPAVGDREGKKIAHGISMITTRKDGVRAEIDVGGKLTVGEDNPFLDELIRAFDNQPFFCLEIVNDIGRTQWEKIALNCGVCVCTVFGLTLGELLARMKEDSRMTALVEGLVFEALQLGKAREVNVSSHAKVMDTIRRAMKERPHHPTSLQMSFKRNVELEVPVLTGAVALQTAGRKKANGAKMEAPLSMLISACLNEFSALRRDCASMAVFHEKYGKYVGCWQELLLDATARDVVKLAPSMQGPK